MTYTEKSKYEGEIPKDSKEELEKLLSENMQKQAEWKETQKTLQKYQMLIQQREQALKKKESIQHELESLSTVTEIPREVYEQAVSDRQKFLNASRIANQNIRNKSYIILVLLSRTITVVQYARQYIVMQIYQHT